MESAPPPCGVSCKEQGLRARPFTGDCMTHCVARRCSNPSLHRGVACSVATSTSHTMACSLVAYLGCGPSCERSHGPECHAACVQSCMEVLISAALESVGGVRVRDAELQRTTLIAPTPAPCTMSKTHLSGGPLEPPRCTWKRLRSVYQAVAARSLEPTCARAARHTPAELTTRVPAQSLPMRILSNHSPNVHEASERWQPRVQTASGSLHAQLADHTAWPAAGRLVKLRTLVQSTSPPSPILAHA